MKKSLWIVILSLLVSISAYADNIKDIEIESMKIGDSALDYFTESKLEDGELDWFNYSYKEYAHTLVPGKGIYDWFQISYQSYDDNFIIEGLVGIILKKKYDDYKCNKELDTAALDISKLLKNTQQGKKQLYKVIYNPSEVFQKPSPSGKSILTSISFDLKDEGKIILSCYNMDDATNQIDSPIKDINQFDTFRIDLRSKALKYYLEN